MILLLAWIHSKASIGIINVQRCNSNKPNHRWKRCSPWCLKSLHHFTSYNQVYIDSISKLYERELQEFFETARQTLQLKTKSVDGKKYSLAKEGKGSAGDLSKLGTRSGKLGSFQDGRGSDQDLTGRQKFDMVSITSITQPLCCISLFLFFSVLGILNESNCLYPLFCSYLCWQLKLNFF